MKNKLCILLLTILPSIGFSQKSAEVTVGIGYSAVDIEGIVEKDEIAHTEATDWGQFNGGVSGQFFLPVTGNIGFGAELMYQHLFWYSIRAPYGSYDIYREYSINTFKITPIVRLGINSAVSFDIGPELNFLYGLKFGALASACYSISISDKIEIPVKLRMEIINYIEPIFPISLHAGIRYRL